MQKQSATNQAANWQLQLSALSLKKRQKIHRLLKLIGPIQAEKALEIGCDKGVISYHLRQQTACLWTSVDASAENVAATRGLVGNGVIAMEDNHLPFGDKYFDLVVCVDFLEHIDGDAEFVKEMRRVLRDTGQMIVTVPHVHPLLIVNRIARWLGITKEYYNHKRDGYSFAHLARLLKEANLAVTGKGTVIGLVTEAMEFSFNFIYSRFLGKSSGKAGAKGRITMGSAKEYKRHKGKLLMLKLLFPLLYILSKLDVLLAFLPGYILVVTCEKDQT